MRKNFGFAVLAPLIGLGLMIVSLVISTAIVKNPDINLNILKKAALGELCRANGGDCVAKDKICKNTLSRFDDCGSRKKCGIDCQGNSAPAPSSTPPGNSCENNGGVECAADKKECKGKELKAYSTKKNLCCEEAKGCKNKTIVSVIASLLPSSLRPNLCEPECAISQDCEINLNYGPNYYCKIIDECHKTCVKRDCEPTQFLPVCVGRTLKTCNLQGSLISTDCAFGCTKGACSAPSP
ncbi:MAG: hypothetical protein U0946_03810, partial [Patescibacteria group bacterium]|nr:hypothetical protein [Patescibacteria group bacterium]